VTNRDKWLRITPLLPPPPPLPLLLLLLRLWSYLLLARNDKIDVDLAITFASRSFSSTGRLLLVKK